MSYDVFVNKFEDGVASPIEENVLHTILSKYGKIVESDFGVEFKSNVGNICESATIMINDDEEVIGIAFNRPTDNAELSNIVFDLLSIKNACFFSSDMGFMLARNDIGNNLPEVLKPCFPNGPKIITKSNESWPLQAQ